MPRCLYFGEQRAGRVSVSRAASGFKLTFRGMQRFHSQLPNRKFFGGVLRWLLEHVTNCTLCR